ncbi:MAG TPA: BON domain-containing protein, partial [Pyrinomonadaceae bacterium]|nr:BON domain-containing protein [Pyrinomonadaceae bacterium]
ILVTNNNANTGIIDWTRDVSRDDFDKDKDRYEREAKEGGSTIGTGANDLWLWTKTRTALAGVDDLRDSTINVDVENAVVTLRGTVANKGDIDRAVKAAKGVEGVTSVNNKLTVSADDSVANVGGNANANTRTNANANR